MVCWSIGTCMAAMCAWNAMLWLSSYLLSLYFTLFCAGNPNVESSLPDLKQVWLALYITICTAT